MKKNKNFQGVISYLQSRSQRERSGRGATHLPKGSGLSWKYWEEMADVIPDVKLRLWDALYEALKKYYANLQQRAKVSRFFEV